ncbi:MAG: 1-acyl-sn-glycerol-3-phosphate acyltransferase [Bacillota bacterium]|nr:1-acyl-sn-glycerol-3-phosphate acyltransferase [Bacillota bacterium]
MNNLYVKPNLLAYRGAQAVCFVMATFVFRRKFLRNEIKGVDDSYVVVANHQCALDFVNLLGATKKRLTFVLSNSFYNSLPVNGILKSLGVIPKQQFQTTVSDMKKMKAVIDSGESLVIYPAGLMCEDGVSTPIPEATYKFLKWLGADIYAARTVGTYFSKPKWTTGIRRGRTYLDIYKLLSKEQLAEMKVSQVKAEVEKALLFNAYEEQEKLQVKYKDCDDIHGLENVLYQCPNCGKEFTMFVHSRNKLRCSACGYEEHSDEFGFLHNIKGLGDELRHVPQWSKLIYDKLKEQIKENPGFSLRSGTKIHMIDYDKHKFVEVGQGTVELSGKQFNLKGSINGESVDYVIPSSKIPTLPFSPGKHFEIQHGQDIFRCVLDDGRLVMKFINALKIFYELNNPKKA